MGGLSGICLFCGWFGWSVGGLSGISLVCGWFGWIVGGLAGLWVVSSFATNVIQQNAP